MLVAPLVLRMIFRLADASSAAVAMQHFVAPVVETISVIASLLCVLFLIYGGFHYITSSGNPGRLEHAKKIIKNAVLGLVVVIGAATIVAVLGHAYGSTSNVPASHGPTFATINPGQSSNGLVQVLVDGVTGLLLNIVESVGSPFMQALAYFTHSTPLMAGNASVFNLWLVIVGIADALFVLVVALLGLHIMSFASFGMDEIEFKHLLPQVGIIFLLLNVSIFAIDSVISLSNAMIYALETAFPSTSVWLVLAAITKQATTMGVAALLIMTFFLVLSVMLLVYYVCRLVVLYLGAVLAPLVLLLWLIPSFKDFAESAAKLYLITVFVLFVQVVILQLATSIFGTVLGSSPNHTSNPIMAMIVGLATVVALLRTQSVISQISLASVGPRTARQLGGQFVNGASYLASRLKPSTSAVTVAVK